MFKKIVLILFTVIFLSGCMPSVKINTHKNYTTGNMIARSLVSSGNTYRINQIIKKTGRNGKIKIAFIGSSAFLEDEYGNSVAKTTCEKIKNILGKKVITECVNFSIENTNSQFGNIMLNSQILSKKPDIIFIDYAVSDGHEQEDRESFEALVRSCLKQENEPQVIIVLNCISENNVKKDFMEQLAKYYNLPVINVSSAFLPEISSGRQSKDNFFTDENTLTENSKLYIADFCANYIKEAKKMTSDNAYNISSPMYANLSVENPKFVDAVRIQAENDGSYVRMVNTENKIFKSKIEYLTNTENKPFVFSVEANNVYMIAPVSKYRNNSFNVSINGKKSQDYSLYSDSEIDIPKVFKLYSDNNIEKILIAIQVNEPENSEEQSQLNESGNNLDKETVQDIRDFEFWGIAYTQNGNKNHKTE